MFRWRDLLQKKLLEFRRITEAVSFFENRNKYNYNESKSIVDVVFTLIHLHSTVLSNDTLIDMTFVLNFPTKSLETL